VILGLNANAGGTKLADALLPAELGTKIWLGEQVGSNRFLLKTWDTNSGAYQVFEFTLNGGLSLDTNGVSRVGFPETLQYKVLDNFKMASNGTLRSGVVLAKGSDYGTTVAGAAGTNRLYIQHQYSWATPTNYLDVTEGVITAIK
jgi:hypothetical protein